MKTHTDTPETRALWHETLDWCQKRDEMHDPYHAKLANLAEKLERERDEAREELSEVKKDYLCLATRLDGHDATECLANLMRIIEQWNRADRLLEECHDDLDTACRQIDFLQCKLNEKRRQ